ncbi:MAG: YciI family protein [Promicromonosporaceae bacterium]|nr:YciI family protein [Promicromonosporaceae bacterium]
MPKFLLLKHYRGVPEKHPNCEAPMEQWTPEEITAHIGFMDRMIEDLKDAGQFVDAQALSPQGTFVRYGGEGKPPVTDGPFAETKDLIAGWMAIDVDSAEAAYEKAAYLSSAPGPGGLPLHEWIEVRPFLEGTPEEV